MKFIDLFAGCGGLSLGLCQAGMEGIFAVERDEMAFRTFAANFLSKESRAQFLWPSWLEKRAWAIDDLLSAHMAEFHSLRGQVEVIAGGPPCQGFSTAGRRKEADPRNQLFRQYARMVDAVRPLGLILENVPGMKVPHVSTLDNREVPVSKSYYEKAKGVLESIGYEVLGRVIHADRFGVPQRRPRLIMLGIRRDLAFFLPTGIARSFEILEQQREMHLSLLGLKAPVPVGQAISDLEIGHLPLQPCVDSESPRGFVEASYQGPRTAYQLLMNRGHEGKPMDSMRLARHRADVRDRFERIQREVPRGVRMNEEHRARFGLLKHRLFPMAELDPAPTLTTLPDDVLHYGEPRILTVRETARIQSFPDWFSFKGKYTTGGDRRTKECPRYTQVGNAVPPLLALAIGRAITATLEEAQANLAEHSRKRRSQELAAA
jgi:DNA (cytosine-5)-methyltransferase 1